MDIMDLGSILILIGLTLLVAVFIARPLAERRSSLVTPEEHQLSALQAERDKILAMIREIEMDHAMGKIRPLDFEFRARGAGGARLGRAARDRRPGRRAGKPGGSRRARCGHRSGHSLPPRSGCGRQRLAGGRQRLGVLHIVRPAAAGRGSLLRPLWDAGSTGGAGVTTRAVILFALAALLAGCSLAGDITPPPALATAQAAAPVPVTTETPAAAAPTLVPGATQAPLSAGEAPPASIDLARGGAIWSEKCAPCHGASGQSDGAMAANLPSPPPQLGNAAVGRAACPADWYDVVTNGRMDRLMPAFASLSDAERWDAVAYALALSAPAADVAAGEALYAANDCAQCHGGGQGGGSGPSFLNPVLVEQRSLSDLATVIRGGRLPSMPAFAGQLSEDQIWSLAAYVRSLAWNSTGTGAPST